MPAAATKPPGSADVSVHDLIEHMTEGVIITDADANIQTVNQAFTSVTGYGASEVIGRNPRILKSGRQDAEFYRDMWATVRLTGRWRGEIWNRRKDGELYLEWLTVSTLKDREGRLTGYLGVFTDVAGRRTQEERLMHPAYYNALTELPNRILLRDRLNHALAEARRRTGLVGVLLIDLDRFKLINDTWGHLVGDDLLQVIPVMVTTPKPFLRRRTPPCTAPRRRGEADLSFLGLARELE